MIDVLEGRAISAGFCYSGKILHRVIIRKVKPPVEDELSGGDDVGVEGVMRRDDKNAVVGVIGEGNPVDD